MIAILASRLQEPKLRSMHVIRSFCGHPELPSIHSWAALESCSATPQCKEFLVVRHPIFKSQVGAGDDDAAALV